MKKTSTLISVIIAIVVLLAALGIGFSVKRIRAHRAQKDESQRQAEPQAKRPNPRAALPGGGEERRPAGLTIRERSDRRDERAREIERVNNMTEEERREFMARRLDARRRPGQGGRRMSDEERQAMRERYENMSEEEREKFREEMRQRFGGRRRGDRGGMPERIREGEPMRRDEGEGTEGEAQENPPVN